MVANEIRQLNVVAVKVNRCDKRPSARCVIMTIANRAIFDAFLVAPATCIVLPQLRRQDERFVEQQESAWSLSADSRRGLSLLCLGGRQTSVGRLAPWVPSQEIQSGRVCQGKEDSPAWSAGGIVSSRS